MRSPTKKAYPHGPERYVKRLVSRLVLVRDGAKAGCWIWTAATNSSGYGYLSVAGSLRGAHVWAYEWATGKYRRKGLVIDHARCDNPPCCNPDHLKLVTPKTNMARLRKPKPLPKGPRKHCKYGHSLADAYLCRASKPHGQGGPYRLCRTCAATRARAALVKYRDKLRDYQRNYWRARRATERMERRAHD